MPPEDTWNAVRAFMQRTCGVVLEADQSYLLDARLVPVARRTGHDSVDSYVRAATLPAAPQDLVRTLIDAMTTHETFFFRDPTFWRSFEADILARVFGGKPRPLTIWSAACSTGQEPYTIAMALAECAPDIAPYCTIHATDVSQIAVDYGKAGVYSILEVNRGLNASRMLRHFEQVPGGFRPKPGLRDRIEWRQHNLLGAMPEPSGCDIVMCRNVLIYFNDRDRKEVIQRLHRAAKPGSGFVGVGSTEILTMGTSVTPGWYVAASSVTRAA